jgi:hypothetical protein
MCLIKVRKEEEEEVYVPYRRVVREERIRTHSPRRSSRVIVARTSEPKLVIPAPAPIAVPAPHAKALPPPQPVPVFVEPTPPPAHHHHNPEVHYVHVSPRSSVSDHGHDDYRYTRREVYERDYSPARSSRADNYEYRYVGAPPPPHRRDRSRSRSRVREYYDEEDDDRRRTSVKVSRRTYDDRY